MLLLLQLLAAVLAVLALARPATPSEPPRHLALVLDASGSMQATDVAPTRFEAARARGMDRLAALRPSDLVSFVRAGREATLLASGAPDTVRGALAAAQPGQSGAAIREALALASSQVAATPDRRGQIVLLTDAAWPRPIRSDRWRRQSRSSPSAVDRKTRPLPVSACAWTPAVAARRRLSNSPTRPIMPRASRCG